MTRLVFALTLLPFLVPAPARAQVEMSIHIGLPVAPPLVVVQPGLQVVENHGEEVFFVDGWYWCRRGDRWYRARGTRAAFMYVEPRRVPYRLAYLPPPGHYRHWRREQLGEERRWWREHDGARRSAWRQHQDAQRHGWKGEVGSSRSAGYSPAPARAGRAHAPAPAPARLAPSPGQGGGGGGHGGHGDTGRSDDGHGRHH